MTTALLLFPDFALILLGAAIRRWMHLGDHFWNGVEKLVYFILFPALLINAIVKTRLDLGAALPLLGTAFAAMAGGMLLGLLPKFVVKLPPLTFASLFQCGYRFNSYIALAVAGMLFGAPGIATMGLIVVAAVPLAEPVPAPEPVAAPEPAPAPVPVPAAPAAAAPAPTTEAARTVALHAEDLVAAKREVPTGVVKVHKKVVVDNASLDVDVYEEKLTVNRTELNDDVVDPNYAFEEGVFEIELRGEEVEVGKRVRRIGQVEFGKERQTRTQRVTGQTRREELEFDEEPYGGSTT